MLCPAKDHSSRARAPLLCFAGNFKGLCKQIDHFPEDADYEADTAEYFLRESHNRLLSLQVVGPVLGSFGEPMIRPPGGPGLCKARKSWASLLPYLLLGE